MPVTAGDIGAVCIAFAGEFGMGTTGTVLAAVVDALETRSPRRLEVNVADVEFMDASGINALVRCRAQAVAAGCRLTVTDPQPIVYEVLRITGMLEALAVERVPAEHGEGSGLPARERIRTVGLGASAGGIEQGPAVMPVADSAAQADRLDADVADTRACRRMAGDMREGARQARERAQAMIVDNDARRTRMRKVWVALDDSAPPAG
jgi:anti-sigma B factor antagonist